MTLAFFDSPRSAGLGLTVDDSWALRWPQLAGTLLPVHHGTNYLFDTLYVGFPVVALALVGLRTNWRMRWRWLVVLLLLIITAFGRAGPLWHLWSALIPGWRGFQYPVKALGAAVIPLALLAGRGLQSPLRRWGLWSGALSGVVLMALGVFSAGLQVLAALFGWLAERRPALATALLSGVLLCLAIDVGWHLGVTPTRPWESVRQRPELAAGLDRAGVSLEGGLYDWLYTVPESMDTRLPNWREVQTEFQVLTLAPDTGALFGLPVAKPYFAGVTRRVFELRASPHWNELASRFGVRARVVTFQGADPPQDSLAFDKDLGAAVVPQASPSPRAYVAFTTVEAQEQLEALSRAPVDTVVVDPGAGLASAGLRALQPVALKRSVDRFEAELSIDAEGLFVINEAFARGWSAQVDGQPVALLPVNAAVMGLRLGAGTHRVRIDYSTPGLEWGLGLSALGLVLLAVIQSRRALLRR